MTKLIRNFIFLVLGIMFVFALTACNSKQGQAESKKGKNDGNSEVNHTDEIVTIKILYPWGEDAFEERYKAIDEKLENIQLELVDSQAQLEPLQELNAKKIIPDVILANWGIEPLKQLDMIQPIDQLIEKHQFDLDTLFPSAVAGARSLGSEGQMPGMPISGGGYALYYNKEVFDLFGESYPSDNITWDEVVELARKLTAERNGNQYRGLEMGSVPAASFDTLVPLLEFAVNLTDPKTGEVRITKEPAVQRYMNLMRDIFDIPGLYDSTAEDDYEFPQGTVAMLITYIDYPRWGIPDTDFIENIDVVPVPVWEDQPLAPPVNPSLHVINKYSEHQDEAFQVISEYVSAEHQSFLGANYAEPPAVIDTKAWAQYGSSSEKFEALDLEKVFSRDMALPPKEISKWDEYVDIQGSLKDFVETDMDIPSFLRVLEEESEAKIKDAMKQEQ
ncbi:ABC transporter substrate-binding protein [Bacillus sp. SD088]|uniref:ABC transporter substrate-binding protein n=1 Tax=Bacillus sp. SD088 TaxID=2782012 RepID=UPI001A97B623|nr:extracellular solute-binding protein [Bacillus sp. SD088]MBO0993193.1 extracellular solute-binding protein [Bacillus sp. SD088]